MDDTKLYHVVSDLFVSPKNGYIPGIAYELFLPKKLDWKKEKLPLIVFLHGAGERGGMKDLTNVHCIGLSSIVACDAKDIPAIILCPRCPEDMVWNNIIFTLKELIDKVAAEYNVDMHRITATGLSMGGFGTWELGITYPEFFAGLAPICGGGFPWRAGNLAKTPVWAFHGDKDDTVPVEMSYQMVNSARNFNDKVRFTIFNNVGHCSWDDAYWYTTVIDWLLEQKRDDLTFPRPIA